MRPIAPSMSLSLSARKVYLRPATCGKRPAMSLSCSSSVMISIARIFGAPVMEPQGKIAEMRSIAVLLGSSLAVIVDVIVWIVG